VTFYIWTAPAWRRYRRDRGATPLALRYSEAAAFALAGSLASGMGQRTMVSQEKLGAAWTVTPAGTVR
jgi:hypothetical protein